MPGQDGFRDPFESALSRNQPAIGSGRGRNGSDNTSNATTSRTDGHSPTSRSDLQPNRAGGDAAAILIRKLPLATSAQALRSMLIFSRDCDGCEFVKSAPGDETYATAIARFRSSEGAHQAKDLLDGRPTEDGFEMRVDIINLTPGGSVGNRPFLDGSSADGVLHRSRFGDTFRDLDRISPRANNAVLNSKADSDGYSPTYRPLSIKTQDPIGSGQRVTGRSVIQQDDGDDETARILDDPSSFLVSDAHQLAAVQRRATVADLPSGLAERFSGLSMNGGFGANGLTSGVNGIVSSRPFAPTGLYPAFSGLSGLNGISQQQRGSISTATSPSTRFPPSFNSPVGSGGRPGQFFPPVNPADQNPPCNTLYVGNLPLDTSEDELKALFSNQRGYKRLCFRTKQNGPMCFVEFEEIQWATRALNELYGTLLSNSVRGGIRLSFSKNPLGVRGPPQQQSPVSPGPNSFTPSSLNFNGVAATSTTFASLTPPGFSTASGPPPGLPTPHGFSTNGNKGSISVNGTYTNSRDNREPAFAGFVNGR